jgi:hypothetical protein
MYQKSPILAQLIRCAGDAKSSPRGRKHRQFQFRVSLSAENGSHAKRFA